MKTIRLLLFVCFWMSVSFALKAQEISQYDNLRRYIGKGRVTTLDSAKIRIIYSLSYIPDSTNLEQIMKDRKVLLVGDKMQHFYSYYIRQNDSVLTKDFDNNKRSAPVKRTRDIKGEGYEIYTNYPKPGRSTIMEPITDCSIYQYEEKTELPTWTIHDDTCFVLNYSCQKAVAHFCGRDWEVWFSSEIPLTTGPWKLQGLPGLIMKANDTRMHYVFECIGLEQLKDKKEPIIQIVQVGKTSFILKCTKGEYLSAQKNFYNNYVDALLSLGINVNVVDANGKSVEWVYTPDKRNEERRIMISQSVDIADRYRKIPYNPIELE
jgi:GLPGLI family protein